MYTNFEKRADNRVTLTRIASNKYKEVETHSCSYPGTRCAIVEELPNGEVTLHSTAEFFQLATRKTPFFEILCFLPSQWLWKDLEIDDDSEWTSNELQVGTLVFVYNRSHNKDLDQSR